MQFPVIAPHYSLLLTQRQQDGHRKKKEKSVLIAASPSYWQTAGIPSPPASAAVCQCHCSEDKAKADRVVEGGGGVERRERRGRLGAVERSGKGVRKAS